MAQESCNLDKDEAEISKPSSSPSPTPSPVAPPSAPPSLFLKLTPPQEFAAQRTDQQAAETRQWWWRRSRRMRNLSRQSGSQLGALAAGRRWGLTGFRCHCGELFYPRHRYSDTHDCSFDYKTAGRAEISKNNPVLRAAKIIKI